MIAHFDTNVFDHIHKRLHGVTQAIDEALRVAISSGALTIPLSTLAIEETLGALASDRQLAFDEFRLILGLSRTDRLLKTPDLLVPEEIKAFAQRSVAPLPYLPMTTTVRRNLDALRAGAADEGVLQALHAEVCTHTAAFRDTMVAAQAELRPLVAKLPASPTFERYWHDLGHHFAAGFAERAGVLKGCRKRGFGALLRRRTVCAAVGGGIALAYLQTFKGRKPRPSDSRDLLHVVVAAAAGAIFVTHDEKLRELALLIPFDGFEVLKLSELLAKVAPA